MERCICCNLTFSTNDSFVCHICEEKYALSDEERKFLYHFLHVCFSEYDSSERSILMSSSTESVIGSCRKIINSIIINLYKESNESLDNLAVAMTYARMYASDRPLAITYFEKYRELPVPIPTIYHYAYSERTMIKGRPAYTPWQIFSKFANIYEAEKQYTEAIKCLENCIIEDNGTNPADFERINKIKMLL